jgi:hypothetical protein
VLYFQTACGNLYVFSFSRARRRVVSVFRSPSLSLTLPSRSHLLPPLHQLPVQSTARGFECIANPGEFSLTVTFHTSHAHNLTRSP